MITTHFAFNYGAVLQAFALQQYIKGLGLECEIIDYKPYRPAYGRQYYSKIIGYKNIILNVYRFINYKRRKAFKRRLVKFDDFIKNNIDLSSKSFYTYNEILNDSDKYDVFVCGSDQIWNFEICYDPVYFLDFKSKFPNAKYIAYAPSIASKYSDVSMIDKMRKHLVYFDYLSVREPSFIEILSKVTDKKITAVLDPVFIYDKQKWNQLISGYANPFKTPYIFCYFVGVSNVSRKVMKILKQITGYDVVYANVMSRNSIDSTVFIDDASPKEFLNLIKYASIVCTNSFHTTAFSILFQKQFMSVMNSDTRNSRILELTANLGLQNRLIYPKIDVADQINAVLNSAIDYSTVETKLNHLIDFSKNYLNDALNNCKG
jgi:hypothetical protein